MRKFKFILFAICFVALVSSCGGRKDACPSVGKVSSKPATFIA